MSAIVALCWLPCITAADVFNLGRPVTRLRAVTVTGEYNDDTLDWSNADALVILDCVIQPVAGTEYLLDRNAVVTRWQWFGPRLADVTSADRILADGFTYDVDGSVEDWDGPPGANLDYRKCLLRRTNG
jgi:hypothetical protein